MKRINLPALAASGAAISLLFFSGFFYQFFQFPKAGGVIFFIALFFLLTIFSSGKGTISLTPPVMVFLAYFLWVSFKSISSACLPPGYYLAAVMSCSAFLVPVILKPGQEGTMAFAAWLSIAACALAMLQSLSGALRPSSFFGNPVFFAEFLLFNMPFIVSGIMLPGKNRFLYVVASAFSAMYMVLAASKGALASLMASLLFLSYFAFKSGAFKLSDIRGKRYYAIFFAVICLLTAFSPGYLKSFKASAANFTGSSSSLSGRAVMALTALEMSREHPFAGAGTGGYRYYGQLYQSRVLKARPGLSFVNSSYAHDDYLQLISETGFAGFILFAALAAALAAGFEKSSAALDNRSYIIRAGLMSCVMAGLAESIYNFPLFVFPGAFMFWFYAGMAASGNGSGYKVQSRVIAVLVLVILAVTLRNLPAQLMSDFRLGYAVKHDKKFSPSAETPYLKSLKLDPSNRDALSRLGASYCVSGEYEKSSAAYEKLLGLYPYSADALYNLGALKLKTGGLKDAAQYFGRSIGLYPSFAQAHMGLAKAYEGMGMKKESLNEFNLAVKYDPYVMSHEFAGSLVFFGEITGEKR